ncbi:DUF6044 family protein [Exiguobacterium artemiae]|uniref:DUF6044 family protein n=1 Tax=Exiguobacterium artemiae TaxID=340145 RepID=UPI0005555908|nr:DUF6044 family protein [Exiguobacterium sibiricum]
MVKERTRILIGILAACVYILPMILLGEQAHIRIHDNLDSNIVWYKTLIDTNTLFTGLHANVPDLLNGVVSRNAFVSSFTGIVWLYQWFPPYTAYVISQLLVRIFAFLGMYLLLRDHGKTVIPHSYALWVAVLFSWTPFWPSGMLSTLGMPLLLWAYWNIWKGRRKKANVLVLLLVPFYSSFVLGIFFFLATLAIYHVIKEIRGRHFHGRFWLAYCTQVILYLLIEYRLVYSMLWEEEPTSRNDFEIGSNGFWATIRLFFKHLVLGHTHDRAAQSPVILLTLLVFGVIVFRKREEESKPIRSLIWFLLGLSLWYAFWFYDGWNPLKQQVSLMRTFNFSRFHFLQPMVWYGLFFLMLDWLWKISKRKIALVLLTAQTAILLTWNPEFVYRHHPSYEAFYATAQFDDIKRYIDRPTKNYQVASIGMHPAIAQYNGMRTVDGYVNFYPLSYKASFRKVIRGELDKSKMLQHYFDTWGNRVYLFSSELEKEYEFTKHHQVPIRHLSIDATQLKRIGATYVLSAVPIQNAEATGLRYEKTFQNRQSAWKIRLYRIQAPSKNMK